MLICFFAQKLWKVVFKLFTCMLNFSVPTVELLNSKNVPEKKMNELKMELNELAKQLLGEVCVMTSVFFKIVVCSTRPSKIIVHSYPRM